MDLSRSNNRTLFDVISEGDDVALQRLLLEGKEERNVATLAVSFNAFQKICPNYFLCVQYPIEFLFTARKYTFT